MNYFRAKTSCLLFHIFDEVTSCNRRKHAWIIFQRKNVQSLSARIRKINHQRIQARACAILSRSQSRRPRANHDKIKVGLFEHTTVYQKQREVAIEPDVQKIRDSDSLNLTAEKFGGRLNKIWERLETFQRFYRKKSGAWKADGGQRCFLRE